MDNKNNKATAKPLSDWQDLLVTLENVESDVSELNALLNVCFCAANADESGAYAHDIARSVGVLSAMADGALAEACSAVRKAREMERGRVKGARKEAAV